MSESTQSEEIKKTLSEEEIKNAINKRKEIIEAVGEAYQISLNDKMGNLHNQFVAFISSANIPLPHVLIVLEIIKKETIDLAIKKYIGE